MADDRSRLLDPLQHLLSEVNNGLQVITLRVEVIAALSRALPAVKREEIQASLERITDAVLSVHEAVTSHALISATAGPFDT